jgi:ABC-type Fe3+/spermidine/putrescine transport system ATPase subunit
VSAQLNERQIGAIRIEAVAKSYGDTEVLSAVDLSIEPGSFVTLLGPSGCGKTTLLRLIAGFISPSRGRICIDGADMAGIPTQRRPIGMVFQNLALFPHLNVFENIAYGLQLRHRPKDEIARRVAQFIEIVGLAGLGERRIAQLSGGQKQRVALARSLVLEPSILLLDEPLSALDLQLRKQLQVALKDIQRKLGTTFVFVTHDQEEATLMSDTIVVMSQGRVQQVANPSTIYAAPANLFVAKFVGELNELPARVTAVGTSLALQTEAGEMRVPASAAQGFTPAVGDAAALCLRPESLVVSSGEVPAHHVRLPAQLVDVISLGPVSRLVLQAAGRRLTSIVMSEQRPRDLAPGSACSLHFDPDKARVYAPLAGASARAFGEAA